MTYQQRVQQENQLNAKLDKELQQCSSELQAQFKLLRQDSKRLSQLFELDPGDDLKITHLLGHTIMMYLGSPIIFEGLGINNRSELLTSFHDELILTMQYTVKRFPNDF